MYNNNVLHVGPGHTVSIMMLEFAGTAVVVLKVLNGVIVGLAVLHTGQFKCSSIAWELFVNTQVNMVISSHMDL